MAGVLVAWIVSHLFAIGEIFDIILLVAGVAAIGYSIFTGMDHLYLFATGAYNARSLPDLDAAADHFAKAVGILGIQAVLAVLFRGRPYGRRETRGTAAAHDTRISLYADADLDQKATRRHGRDKFLRGYPSVLEGQRNKQSAGGVISRAGASLVRA